MKKLQLQNQRFGRIFVIAPAATLDHKHTRWLCRCDCGNDTTVNTDALVRGLTNSCGCLATEQLRNRSLTHGATINRKTTREYKSWSHAKSRCGSITNPKFRIYGQRGISMCAEWRDDFQRFLSDMGACPAGYTLDRIDVNGDYTRNNCRWASPITQANNTRFNTRVLYQGVSITLKELSRKFNVNYSGLHAAVKYRGRDPIKYVKKMARNKFRLRSV